MKTRVIIMGAAGRDFHNFNAYFRENPHYEVVAFTAAQIEGIAGRVYPPALSGKLYPHGIDIYPESQLAELIKKFQADLVVLAYSDLSNQEVMEKAAAVLAAGCDFMLLGPKSTMLKSKKPVIAVCAVRTGSGKSMTTQRVFEILRSKGKRVVVVRHPMPYGNLEKQEVQRFTCSEELIRQRACHMNLIKQGCTIEEMEEYESKIEAGGIVYAGVDYGKILLHAEKEADIILWDGGNNDFPFFKPDLLITLVDPLRPGHEKTYYPGRTCLIMADIVIISKVNSAKKSDVEKVVESVKELNPRAKIVKAESVIEVEDPKIIQGKRVLVIEDGPTLTHGGMGYGAGYLAARKYGAKIIDPRKYAVGSIRGVFEKYKHLKAVLPAMGYSKKQMEELEKTINRTPCDVVLIGTMVNLGGFLKIKKPWTRVRYRLKEKGNLLEKVLESFI